MKNRTQGNVVTFFILSLVLYCTGMLQVLPWWSFLIPCLVLGMIISLAEWTVASFRVGFLSGFVIWAGGNAYNQLTGAKIVADKIALLLSAPGIVVLLISGIIGGLLNGLALYTGKKVFSGGRGSLADQQKNTIKINI